MDCYLCVVVRQNVIFVMIQKILTNLWLDSLIQESFRAVSHIVIQFKTSIF